MANLSTGLPALLRCLLRSAGALPLAARSDDGKKKQAFWTMKA